MIGRFQYEQELKYVKFGTFAAKLRGNKITKLFFGLLAFLYK